MTSLQGEKSLTLKMGILPNSVSGNQSKFRAMVLGMLQFILKHSKDLQVKLELNKIIQNKEGRAKIEYMMRFTGVGLGNEKRELLEVIPID